LQEWLGEEWFSGSSIFVPSDAAFERLAKAIRPGDANAADRFNADTRALERVSG